MHVRACACAYACMCLRKRQTEMQMERKTDRHTSIIRLFVLACLLCCLFICGPSNIHLRIIVSYMLEL